MNEDEFNAQLRAEGIEVTKRIIDDPEVCGYRWTTGSGPDDAGDTGVHTCAYPTRQHPERFHHCRCGHHRTIDTLCKNSGRTTIYHGPNEPPTYQTDCTCGTRITVTNSRIPDHPEIGTQP